MKFLKTALFCALTAGALPAQSATATLDLTTSVPAFADGFVNNGDTASSGGFSLTFQNIRSRSGFRGPVNPFGVVFSTLNSRGIASADLIFNIDTVIDTYDVGFADPSSSFRLIGINGTSGSNSFRSRGTSAFNMGAIPVFLAGEKYTLSYAGPGGATAIETTLSALGLSDRAPAVIPLPASLPLILVGLGALAMLRRQA